MKVITHAELCVFPLCCISMGFAPGGFENTKLSGNLAFTKNPFKQRIQHLGV